MSEHIPSPLSGDWDEHIFDVGHMVLLVLFGFDSHILANGQITNTCRMLGNHIRDVLECRSIHFSRNASDFQGTIHLGGTEPFEIEMIETLLVGIIAKWAMQALLVGYAVFVIAPGPHAHVEIILTCEVGIPARRVCSAVVFPFWPIVQQHARM